MVLFNDELCHGSPLMGMRAADTFVSRFCFYWERGFDMENCISLNGVICLFDSTAVCCLPHGHRERIIRRSKSPIRLRLCCAHQGQLPHEYPNGYVVAWRLLGGILTQMWVLRSSVLIFLQVRLNGLSAHSKSEVELVASGGQQGSIGTRRLKWRGISSVEM